MNNNTTLLSKIQNSPLWVSLPSNEELITLANNAAHKNIFTGFGLATSTQLSSGVPFDILGVLFSAELLRRNLNMNRVVVLIADTHAVSNNLFSKKEITNRARLTTRVIQKVIQNCNLNKFEILVASDIRKKSSFKTMKPHFPKHQNKYLQNEVADVLWLQTHKQVALKVGWTMSKGSAIGGHDERFFDQTIKQFCPQLLFAHLKPGRTFDPQKPRTSPYISVAGENRLVLETGVNVAATLEEAQRSWSDNSLGGAKRHLSHIVRLFEQLTEPFPFLPFEVKLQTILDIAVKNNSVK